MGSLAIRAKLSMRVIGLRGCSRSFTASPQRSLIAWGMPPIFGFSVLVIRMDTQMPRQLEWKMEFLPRNLINIHFLGRTGLHSVSDKTYVGGRLPAPT